MSPLVDDRSRAVGEDLKDLVKLHVDLARTEVRYGSTRVLCGLVAVVAAVGVGVLGFLFGTAGLYLVLRDAFGAAAAAGLVALLYVAICALALGIGIRLLKGVRSLMLPRTRQMLWELFTWREDKSES